MVKAPDWMVNDEISSFRIVIDSNSLAAAFIEPRDIMVFPSRKFDTAFLVTQRSRDRTAMNLPSGNLELTLRHEAWERRKRLELRNLSLEPCG